MSGEQKEYPVEQYISCSFRNHNQTAVYFMAIFNIALNRAVYLQSLISVVKKPPYFAVL